MKIRTNSKKLSPTRCVKHKDFNETWSCGPKCFKKSGKILKIYRPFDYIYDPKSKLLIRSTIQYYIK